MSDAEKALVKIRENEEWDRKVLGLQLAKCSYDLSTCSDDGGNFLHTASDKLTQWGWTRSGQLMSRAAANSQYVIPVAIAAVKLSWQAIQSLRAWYKGEICGKRCVKDIIDGGLIAGGTAAGTIGGGLAGSILGPAGAVLGAFVGGILGGAALAALTKRLTENLFDLAPTVAAEKAYRYFGLTHHCSNGEINSAYRRLALQKHPDKGGSAADFAELQANLAVIKLHRNDL